MVAATTTREEAWTGPKAGLFPEPECWRFHDNPLQAAFLSDQARYRAIVAGIGGGKSEVAAFDLVRHMWAYPGIEAIAAAPSYSMIYRSGGPCPVIKRVAAWWGVGDDHEPLIIEEINRQDGRIDFTNGSTIWLCYAADPDALRAAEVSLFWLDEAALVSDEAFRNLVGRARQPGGDPANPYPHRGWVTTTPRGKNWVFDRFVKDRDDWSPERRARYGFHTWSTYANPGQRPEDLEAMEEVYGKDTDWWRQEMRAEFVVFRGLVYHLGEGVLVQEAPPLFEFEKIIGLVDWGVTAPGCILVLGVDRQGQHWLLDEVYMRGVVTHGNVGGDWATEGERLRELWGIEVFIADPEDSNAILGWRQRGLNVRIANNARLEGVRQCQSVLTADRLCVVEPACPNWIAEIGQYHWRQDRDGEPLLDADPGKQNDHAMDAWRYGEMELSQAPTRKAADFVHSKAPAAHNFEGRG